MNYGLIMAVSPSGINCGWTDPPVGPHVYSVPTYVYIFAYANPGYEFEYWEDEMGGRVYYYAAVILADIPNENRYATAHFKTVEVTQHALTIAVNPPGSGWTSPVIGTYLHNKGEVVRIDAFPNPGYEFSYWEDEAGNKVYDPAILLTMDKDHTVTAHYTATGVPQYSLTIAVDPLNGGWTEPPIGSYSHNEGTIVILDAFAYSNYEFEYWEDEAGNKIYDPTAQITMDSDHTVTAHFKPTAATQHTLTVELQGSGSMMPGGGVFNEGDVVQLTAYPSSGWKFDRWEGTDSNLVNPTTVTMNQNKLVVVVFVEGEEPEEPEGIDLSNLVGMMMIVMMMSVVMGGME